MKKLMAFNVALTMTLSLLSTSAFAQGTTSTTKRKVAPNESALSKASSYLANGFNFGFEYMNLNSSEMDVKSKVTGSVEKGIKNDLSNSSKLMGAKFGFKQIKRSGLGMDMNLSVLKVTSRSEGTPESTQIQPSANFIVAAPDYVYGALGLNTNFVLGDTSSTYSPRIGYQVGAGTMIGKNFNFEVFYSWINVGLESQYALMETRTTTTNARLIYVF